MPSFTERHDGPDGQYVELLTRFPYDQAQRIEEASVSRMNDSAFADAVLREAAYEFMVKNLLTGEESTTYIGVGDPAILIPWRDRACELYTEWRLVALPKDASRRKPRQSGTSAKSSSRS